jgi:hypothetical protein
VRPIHSCIPNWKRRKTRCLLRADAESSGLLIVWQNIAIREAIEQILIIWTAPELAE